MSFKMKYLAVRQAIVGDHPNQIILGEGTTWVLDSGYPRVGLLVEKGSLAPVAMADPGAKVLVQIDPVPDPAPEPAAV